MKNSFTRGRGWDGSDDRNQMTVTYNGLTQTLDAWARQLECSSGYLRARLNKADKGQMSWDEAMADKAGRKWFIDEKKRKAQAKAAGDKGRETQRLNREKARKQEELRQKLTNEFLYGSLGRA